MVADIRAQISCNLGEVISGNWSDEAIAVGQGLIRCRGQLILRGIVVPEVGTLVRLAYVRNGQLARVPRMLRVLSSFADPLRQTTTVQLGDKLVWLESKKQGPTFEPLVFPPNPQPGDLLTRELPYPPPENGTSKQVERRVYNGICWRREIVNPEDAFNFDFENPKLSSYEQNPDRPADEELRAPVTISAKAVMSKCLAALELTSTGIPLTSYYEETEIDLKNGYVAAMEQLLGAECFVGYLDEQERLVIAKGATDEPGAGPVIRETDIIDISPIGSGDLPMDDPVVTYEIKPKEPPKQPDPVAPIVQDFIAGSSYNGSTVTLGSTMFTIRAWIDPAIRALARPGAGAALYSVNGGTGGSVTLEQSSVVFTPEEGFNGTATFTYQVTDGFQLSNTGTVYVRVSSSAATPEEQARDAEEQPSENPAPPPGPSGSTGSWSTTEGSREETRVTYQLNGVAQSKVYAHYPSSATRENTNLRGNIDYKEERQYVGRAASLGNVLQRYLEVGSVPDADGSVTVTTITRTQYRQISKGGENRPKEKPPLRRGACTINGVCPADLALPENPATGAIHQYGDCSYRFNGTYWEIATGTVNDPDTKQNPRLTLGDAKQQGDTATVEEEPVSETVTTYEPGEIAIGSLSWPEGILPPLKAGEYIGEEVRTDYIRNRSQGITRTITTRFAAAYKTPEGQQRLNAQSAVYGTGLDVQEWIRDATTLVFAGQTTNTRYDANFGIRPGAPNEVPTTNRPDGIKTADTGGKEEAEPVPASTGSKTGVPDLKLPLTPTVPKVWDKDNGYQEQWEAFQRNNANVLALRYARTQRSIAYGNRYGMSLQLVPWVMPRYPLEPIYLDLAGVVGAYRTNGITVAFDSNGVVANVDALLVGGVGGTGSAYFPVPSTVTSLPAAPSSTTTPDVLPWSSIPVPPDFDPASPGDVLETIPSQDAVEYPESLLPSFIILPTAQTIAVDRGIRVGLRAKRLNYSALPLDRVVALGPVVGFGAIVVESFTLTAAAGSFTVTGSDAALATGTSGTWTPASLTTTAWYDAGTSGDFTLDSGTVSQWNDRSGNARHMTQATGASKPAYASATQNSLNLVTFDGTNDFLESSALSNFISASAFTVLVVVRHRDTKVGTSDSYNNEAILADDGGYFGLHTNGPSGTGSIQVLGYNWDGNDDKAAAVIGANNVWSVLVYTHGSGTLSLYRNGGTATTAASGDTEDLSGTLELGRSGVVNLYQEMDLAEVVILSSEVGTSDRQKLEGYAAHRWGLDGDLPGGHPYKSAAP